MKHPQDLSVTDGQQLLKVNKVEKMEQEVHDPGKFAGTVPPAATAEDDGIEVTIETTGYREIKKASK